MTKDYTNRKYNVLPYDPEWAKQFEAEAEKIKAVFGEDAVQIEHIGSTSISGLSAQPVIDILLLVSDISVADKYIAAMEALGYKYFGEYVKENSRFFAKEENNKRLVNLHIFPVGHPHVDEILKLRDYFRSNLAAAKEYEALKEELFNQHPDNYGQYRKEKDKYLDDLMEKIQ